MSKNNIENDVNGRGMLKQPEHASLGIKCFASLYRTDIINLWSIVIEHSEMALLHMMP